MAVVAQLILLMAAGTREGGKCEAALVAQQVPKAESVGVESWNEEGRNPCQRPRGGLCFFLPFTHCKQMSRCNACDEQSKSGAEVKAVTSAALVKGSAAERLRKQTGSPFVFIVWEIRSVCL